MNKKTIDNELHWINYVKAISIIAIYYIHSQEFFEYTIQGFARYIVPFYVNAFFFISGYLLFRKQISGIVEHKNDKKRLIINILFRLIIPSILFSIVVYFPSALIQGYELSILSLIEKTIWGDTFWFISALVVAELVLYGAFSLRIRNVAVYIAIGIIFYLFSNIIGTKTITNTFTTNPWNCEKGFYAVIFLVGGGVYWRYEGLVDKIIRKPLVFVALLLLYFITLFYYSAQIKVLISINSFNLFGTIISFLSIMLLITICKTIKTTNNVTRIFDKMGRHSIGFYFVCGAIPKVIMVLLPKVLEQGTIYYMLTGFALSLIIAYIVVTLMVKYTPFVFDIRNGFGIRANKQTQ